MIMKKINKNIVLLSLLSFTFFFALNSTVKANKSDTLRSDLTQTTYSKVPLFEWSRMSYSMFRKTQNNATFKYFPKSQTQPMLMAFEIGQKFRMGGTGGKLDLNFHGNKTVLKHQPNKSYSELTLPNRINYEGNATIWLVFTIDMNLVNESSTYSIPFQCRFNLSPKAKTEITLKPSGNILFSTQDTDGTKNSFWTNEKFDTNEPFKVQIRLSSKGDYIVYINDQKRFSKQVNPKYYNNGISNRIWFEGETEINQLSLEEWIEESQSSGQFGLDQKELNNYNAQIADFFKNIDSYYDGVGFILESGQVKNKMSIKPNSFQLDSFEQLGMRREYFPVKGNTSETKWGYRVALYLNGTVERYDGGREEITLPVVYQFLDPSTGIDDLTIYTVGVQNAYPSNWDFIQRSLGY